MRSKLAWLLANVLYYGFARHLPYSRRPYAFGSRRVRYAICRHMFAYCGTNVNIEHGAMFGSGKDIKIGNNSGIGVNAWIAGGVIIGENVMMGHGCTLLGTSHSFDRLDIPILEQPMKPYRSPVIEDDVWIGAHAIILPGVRIGRGSIVGAGSVVTRSVDPFSIVGGNPARLIRRRTDTTADSAHNGSANAGRIADDPTGPHSRSGRQVPT